MKTPLVILLIVSLVLAQGLRLCVHAQDATQGATAHSSLVHYESDSEPEADDGGYDFEVTYLLQGLDSSSLLTGATVIALLLFTLLLMAGSGRPFFAAQEVRPSPHGFSLQPPLRAPPF
jgi:hypothetical protein